MSENRTPVVAPATASGVLVVVVLAALSMTASGLVDTRAVPAPVTASVSQVPIQLRELVCPEFASDGSSVVDVSSQGTGDGSLVSGVNRLRSLPSTAGIVSVQDGAEAGLRITASGSPARGLLALRQDTTSSTSASVECLEPRSAWWFAGGGATVNHRSFLVLRNLDPGDAALQLRVFTAQGEVEPVIDSQVIVPGSSQRRIDLSLLTSFKEELTVAVVAERGLVAASMHDSLTASPGSRASTVTGEAWLSGQALPQRTLVFAGDLGTDKSDELVVTNPAGQTATVTVEVASGNGWFAPQEVPSFVLGAGQVTGVDLTGVLDGGVNAVRVVSTRPVVGIIRRGSASDMTESEPLPELAAESAAVVPTSKGARLVVVGGPQGGTADVSYSGAGGQVLDSQRIALSPGQTTVLALPDGTRRVDLVPSAGSVFAGVTSRSPGIDSVAVRPLALTVRQPNVSPLFHAP